MRLRLFMTLSLKGAFCGGPRVWPWGPKMRWNCPVRHDRPFNSGIDKIEEYQRRATRRQTTGSGGAQWRFATVSGRNREELGPREGQKAVMSLVVFRVGERKTGWRVVGGDDCCPAQAQGSGTTSVNTVKSPTTSSNLEQRQPLVRCKLPTKGRCGPMERAQQEEDLGLLGRRSLGPTVQALRVLPFCLACLLFLAAVARIYLRGDYFLSFIIILLMTAFDNSSCSREFPHKHEEVGKTRGLKLK